MTSPQEASPPKRPFPAAASPRKAFPHSEALPPDVLEARLAAYLHVISGHLAETLLAEVRQMNEALLAAQEERLRALKPLLSLPDVAKTLSVSERTAEKLVATGKLRPLWIGGQRRFHPDAVDAYLRTCEHRRRSKLKAKTHRRKST